MSTSTETPVKSTRKGAKIAIALGLLVASVHLILGVAGVMTKAQWISGLVLGLLVAGLGNHARVFGRR